MFKRSDKESLPKSDPVNFAPKVGHYELDRIRDQTLDEAKAFIEDAIDLYGGGTVLHIVIQGNAPPWIRLDLEANIKIRDAAKAKLTAAERKLLGLD